MKNPLKNLLVARIAEHLRDSKHVAVGASSPIPAAAALVAKAINPGLRVSLLGSEKYTAFTDGGRELFDCAAQGRIDTFFLSGVQIDGQANINLVGTGDYPAMQQRYAGSFGSAYLYHQVPRVILFCWAHSSRTLVERVDFISAAGPRNDGTWRRGGPIALLTDRCEFTWQDNQRFFLDSIHPGQTLQTIRDNTGFTFATNGSDSDQARDASEFRQSTHVGSAHIEDTLTQCAIAETQEILQATVLPQLEELYPQFVQRYQQLQD